MSCKHVLNTFSELHTGLEKPLRVLNNSYVSIEEFLSYSDCSLSFIEERNRFVMNVEKSSKILSAVDSNDNELKKI